jgi:hypothetical protein
VTWLWTFCSVLQSIVDVLHIVLPTCIICFRIYNPWNFISGSEYKLNGIMSAVFYIKVVLSSSVYVSVQNGTTNNGWYIMNANTQETPSFQRGDGLDHNYPTTSECVVYSRPRFDSRQRQGAFLRYDIRTVLQAVSSPECRAKSWHEDS